MLFMPHYKEQLVRIVCKKISAIIIIIITIIKDIYIIFLLQMCLALRYFATGANYSVIGDFQGVSKSTVCNCVREVSSYFMDHVNDYVIFPRTLQQREDKANEFAELYDDKPFVMGCIDGTHIAIIRPVEEEPTFINRKNYASLNVMVSKYIYFIKILFHIDVIKILWFYLMYTHFVLSINH